MPLIPYGGTRQLEKYLLFVSRLEGNPVLSTRFGCNILCGGTKHWYKFRIQWEGEVPRHILSGWVMMVKMALFGRYEKWKQIHAACKKREDVNEMPEFDVRCKSL
ncbi:uncharacterized protein MCYG_05898 [Microsporum canis CBS 113480]|uniref:Uncharacterized protein n=1 Tax=Arthroderma otae (strain ATCC MYA-4605 / CBS 113480) TaxID=554155 RepID=C5FT76_ARTOC|nr:uncharacterized protein MCYG_05898 [Microsporum canis CBS 113480]EEQ33079.1 predicted protein [Microsporum canis CBS 113480]